MWLKRREIDMLAASGCTFLNEEQTRRNRWTTAGCVAPDRYRYTTPMAWATIIHQGLALHFIHCGRDANGQRVAAQFAQGPKTRCNRTVGMGCHVVVKALA
jgi:hypothetical protein